MTIESPLQTQAVLPLPPQGDAVAPSPKYVATEYFMPDLCVEPKGYRRLWLGVALLVVACFAFVVLRFFGGGDSGVDQNAYLVGGRLLAQHLSMKYTLPNPYAYTGGMFVRVTPVDPVTHAPVPGGDYFPKYPFGLPLLYAMFFWAFKVASMLPILKAHVDVNRAVYWAFFVSPVSAIAAVAGMFFLARQVAGSFAAVLAAILLGSSQLMLMLADNPNSHASCLAFIVWGMYFCVRWMQSGKYWHGMIGGLLVGYAATIRYSEILLFVAMCVVVLSRLPWNQKKTWRSVSIAGAFAAAFELIMLQYANGHPPVDEPVVAWTAFQVHLNIAIICVLMLYGITALFFSVKYLHKADWLMYARAIVPGVAWAVPVGTLLLVNHHTMGSFTGYDSTHESEFGAAFKWQYFWQNWEKAVRVFYDLGLFFVVPFAVAGLVMLFRRSGRVGIMMLAWLVPGVMLYMSYYWSPDRADAYARFFLTYLPALLVGTAVCFNDGLLADGREFNKRGGISLTLAAGLVVAIASGVSLYRTIHGLRDGAEGTKIPLNDFRERLALSQTGQMLLDNVPEKSVLFAENTGGIATPSNYIQFLRDWELYGADAFSVNESRRGFGGGGNRQRNNGGGGNGRGNANNNARGGGNRGGFAGGGPPGGNANGNGQNDTTTVVAAPIQPEQQEYHASLYKNMSARQLYAKEKEVIDKAFSQGRRVFVVAGDEHTTTETTGGNFAGAFFGGGGQSNRGSSLVDFKDGLAEVGKYTFKSVARWQDVSLPPEEEDAFTPTDNNPRGGGGGGRGGGMNMNRMFLGSERINDWELVEIRPVAAK